MRFTKIIGRESAIVVLAIILFYFPLFAQSVKRVNFNNSKTQIVFTDSAKVGEKDIYIIKLAKGQNYQIEVIWEGEDITNEPFKISGYWIIFPNKKKLHNPPTGFLQPPISGDYKIVVAPWIARTDYRYRIIFSKK